MNDALKTAGADNRAAQKPLATLDVTVLSGGPGDEREVSLASGQAVATALLRCGHRVSLRDISPEDLSALDRSTDFVFVALHGEFGEDGGVQRFLDERGLPYCGSGAEASALAMHKPLAKRAFIEAGVPTPQFEVTTADRAPELMSRWRAPVVVKPVASGSSVDTFIVHNRRELRPMVEHVARRHGEVLVEEYIRGPELTVGILGDMALPVCEIRTRREFYNYQAKYIDEDTQYLFDFDMAPGLLRKVQELSLTAKAALGCRDFCRVDWIVDEVTHQPYVLEINTIPGFTGHSLLPKAAARAGISFDELCQRIVNMGLKRA